MDNDCVTLPFLLKELKLSSMVKSWQEEADLAVKNNYSHSRYLSNLCDAEIALRYHKRSLRYIRESKLPHSKTLSTYDFNASPSIDKQQINNFCISTEWVSNRENLLLFGPSGIGKTHLASAIGYSLIEKGIRVKFSTTISMVQHLQKAKADLRLMEELAKMDKYRLLVLDDIGYVSKNDVETSVLFELISYRYESGSIIITANQPFSEWDKIFSDNMTTVAAIDRLIHHSTIIECSGESYRKKQLINKSKQR